MFGNILFILSASLTIGSAALVAWTKNIMHACVFLLGSLIGVAGLYLSMGADFVATTQVMVYVGGVVILMLFAVMLTGGKDFISKAQAILGLIPSMGNKWTYAIGVISALVFFMTIGKIIVSILKVTKTLPEAAFESTVERIGLSLITDHVLAFEISSVLLLGAFVGAAIIARPRKEGN